MHLASQKLTSPRYSDLLCFAAAYILKATQIRGQISFSWNYCVRQWLSDLSIAAFLTILLIRKEKLKCVDLFPHIPHSKSFAGAIEQEVIWHMIFRQNGSVPALVPSLHMSTPNFAQISAPNMSQGNTKKGEQQWDNKRDEEKLFRIHQAQALCLIYHPQVFDYS